MTAVLDAPQEALTDVVLGSTLPRLFTPPLVAGPAGPCGCGCALTEETSLGFMFERFVAEVVGATLLPYQRWLAVHMLERCPDGRFRFSRVLVLIGRQNGKTFFLKLLALFMLFMGHANLVLGAAQSLDIAREAWQGAVELAEDVDDLAAEVDTVRYTNGEQCLTLGNGARYRITAATRGAGRGLSVDMLILDELREHRTWNAWSALSKTTTARPNSLIVCISNAGDDESVVLNSLRSSALAGIEVARLRAFGGAGDLDDVDDSLGLFEWSAPDGCDLDDVQAWAAANPGLGRTVSAAAIRSAMLTDPPATFRTETLCQRVDALDAAIDLASWSAGADPSADLGSVRSRVAAVIDVAPDGAHVTLAGAAVLDDDRVRVEVLAEWSSTVTARRELVALLGRIRPAAVGWFPSGPAAELGVELRGMGAVEIKGGEVVETCQEFAGLVGARRVLHPNDPLLNAHVAGTSKLHSGDGWRFARKGTGHVDAAYAAAGAVRLARTMPAPEPRRLRARIF